MQVSYMKIADTQCYNLRKRKNGKIQHLRTKVIRPFRYAIIVRLSKLLPFSKWPPTYFINVGFIGLSGI